jgi:predicted TIM-barrel fold metal-dependent hydrolase
MSKARKTETTIENTQLSITFAPDSETPQVRTFDLASLSDEMREQLAMHGLKQKLTDSFSNVDLEHINDALEKTNRVWTALSENNFRVQSGGEGSVRVTQLAQAIAAVKGVDVQVVVDKLAAINAMEDQDQAKEILKNLRSAPAVKVKLAELRAEAAKRAAEAAEKAASEASGDDDSLSGLDL